MTGITLTSRTIRGTTGALLWRMSITRQIVKNLMIKMKNMAQIENGKLVVDINSPKVLKKIA